MFFLKSISAALLLAAPFLLENAAGFVARPVTPRARLPVCHAETTKANILGGVNEFESWFSSVSGASCSPSVTHAAFGSLRGLDYSSSPLELTKGELLTVPRSRVLQSDFSLPDWDANLAEQLWMECVKGTESEISGYCELLKRGSTDKIPPSTAPDSLRHWTDEQKQLLVTTVAGERLIELQNQQEGQWKRKFSKIKDMSWDEFEWAMEVVHSRAFCGDFGIGSSPISPVLSAAIPLVAAVAGYVYFVQMHGQDDIVLLGLGVAVAVPAIINLLSQSPPAAVLLPLIDSANHREGADSTIDYSPLSSAFTLSAGPGCLVEEDGKKQLYINYGKKKDVELLLNYGFLEGVTTKGGEGAYRKGLAETFLQRNG
jgi:hypothetical protein